MNRSMLENTTFITVAALLIGGLVLFGCSRTEQDSESMPHGQQSEENHDHGDHSHGE